MEELDVLPELPCAEPQTALPQASHSDSGVRCRAGFRLFPKAKKMAAIFERGSDLVLVTQRESYLGPDEIFLTVEEARAFARAIYQVARRVQRRSALSIEAAR